MTPAGSPRRASDRSTRTPRLDAVTAIVYVTHGSGRAQLITPSSDGVVLDVRVIPRAGRSQIAGTRAGALLVRLGAAPVDGAANAELIEVLAGFLGVPRRDVALIAGERSRVKRVHVRGVTVEGVTRLLVRLPN